MNTNIIESIELCDLSAKNARLREETCRTIIKGLEEIKTGHRICNLVREAFQTMQMAEQRQEEMIWWIEAFNTYKNLWTSIKSKEAEPELSESSRLANLRFLEALLFSTKITILVLATESECDDCCVESLSQLIGLTQFIRLHKQSQEPTE